MNKLKHWTTFLVLASQLGIIATDNCPYVDCDCIIDYIDCKNHGLVSMPTCSVVQEVEYTTLLMDTNQITAIQGDSLPIGLIEISMMDNPIIRIDDDAFDKLSTTLESLSFTNAQFTTIPNAFLHLNALKKLTIMSTKIINWNTPAMTHIGQTLQILNLENVGLTSWPEWLLSFSQLNELSITCGTINFIPDYAFDRLTNRLITLVLTNNSLTSTSKSFSKLQNTIILDLQLNKISKLTWLPHSFRLMDLLLSNNNISDANHLSNALRVYSASLLSSTLSHNQLEKIPDLSPLVYMTTVDLSHNKISDPASGSVANGVTKIMFSFNRLPSIPSILMKLRLVKFLDLSRNVIRELVSEDIPPWATTADFSFNLITELTNTSFPVNCSISDLNLSYNAIYTISDQAFQNLPFLHSLKLQGTRLSRLPVSLAVLPYLDYLDMTECSYLVCTCKDRELVSKVASRLVVRGYCGEISIDNFFATFTLTCP